MDKFDYFKDDVNSSANNGNTTGKDTFGFHLYGKTDKDEVKVDSVKADSSDVFEKTTDSAVDVFELAASDPGNSTSAFVQPPDSIRPTYIPRFTEVSETYRMKDDPRPRPKTDTHTVKATKEESTTVELDPTTEKLEEKEVKKVVVTSAVIRNTEPTDETMTVLKFSTPTYQDEDEREETVTENETEDIVNEFITKNDDVDDAELEEFTDTATDNLIIETTVEEKTKNTTIPDPERKFEVVDFTRKNEVVVKEPLGASESEKKTKGGRRGEFEVVLQRDGIKDRFLDVLMSIRVRLVGSIILLVAMMLIDCLPYFGVDIIGMIGLSSIPYARAFIDIQFSVCIFLFALPEVLKSFGNLLKGKCSPELFLVLLLAVIVAGDLVIIKLKATDYLTFGAIYGFGCVVTVIAAYNKTVADFTSFKLVSRNVAKNVIDKSLTRELVYENIALDGAVDEYKSKTARMFRTVFVTNFFKRTAKSCENSVNTVLMMGIGFGISVVAGVVSFLLDGYSPVSGMQSATFVLVLGLPMFSILVHKVPYRHACSNVAEEESAFVGESSIYDGSDIDVITYEDTEIFGIEDVSLRKVHLYGKVYNTPKAMKQMYALFSVVGGPLDFVFSASLDRKCSSATGVVIEENGVSGTHEGRQICAGTEEYMKAHGITLPEDDYRTNPLATDSTKVMYGAENGEVYVKFFIRYSFSEEFTMLLPDLKEKKIVPLVYTRDPNITGDLLKVLTLGEDIIRVMKKDTPRSKEEKTYRRIDSGIVTHGDKGNAINMLLIAKEYTAFQRSLEGTELISMIVGSALAVVLAIGDMLVLPATLLALWQVVWCVVFSVRSKLFFRRRLDREDDNEQ